MRTPIARAIVLAAVLLEIADAGQASTGPTTPTFVLAWGSFVYVADTYNTSTESLRPGGARGHRLRRW